MSLEGKEADRRKASQEGGLGETVKVVVQALLIALVVRTFLFQPFNIPSGSLIPTLLVGDYLFVSKYAYGYSKYSFPDVSGTVADLLHVPKPPDYRDVIHGRILATPPKRGDIAVFKFPLDNSTDYIKRVIGLPGDRIQLVHARLIINGQMAPREPIQNVTTTDQFGNQVEVPTYNETLPGGVTHRIIQRDGDDGSIYSNTPVYVVPPNDYFMMGDNRDNSTDSRVAPEQGGVGYVPFENFVGRAELIFFSIREDTPIWQFWRWPTDVRWNRLFTLVR
jgi:signal peptidase I